MGEVELPEPESGLVAVAGDWGGSGWAVTSALPAIGAARIDSVLHAGDLFSHGPNLGYVRALEDVAVEHGIRAIYLVAGNHDQGQLLSELRRDWKGEPSAPFSLRGVLRLLPRVAHWEWAPRRWLAVHGAVSLDFHTRHGLHFDPAAETILDSDVDAAAAAGKVDLLVSHDPPLNPQTPAVARVREENPFGWAPTSWPRLVGPLSASSTSSTPRGQS
jgi:3',5'-cyclic AMP phosphodiesterase CpdA